MLIKANRYVTVRNMHICSKIYKWPISWLSRPQGWKKCFISREVGQFSHDLYGNCMCFCVQKCTISLQIPKFPSNHQHFPRIWLPNYPFFPTMVALLLRLKCTIFKRKFDEELKYAIGFSAVNTRKKFWLIMSKKFWNYFTIFDHPITQTKLTTKYII